MPGGFNIIPPQFQVGPRGPYTPGQNEAATLGDHGELMATQLDPEYRALVRANKLFFAANQADTTWTVALAAIHTGLCVYNPAGSGKNLSILGASIALNAAPAAIAPMGLAGGWAVGGVAVHTTPLVVYTAKGLEPAGALSVAGADAAATLPGVPIWAMPLLGGFTAGALFGTSPSLVGLKGIMEIPPGGFVFVVAMTVVHALASIWWTELDP